MSSSPGFLGALVVAWVASLVPVRAAPPQSWAEAAKRVAARNRTQKPAQGVHVVIALGDPVSRKLVAILTPEFLDGVEKRTGAPVLLVDLVALEAKGAGALGAALDDLGRLDAVLSGRPLFLTVAEDGAVLGSAEPSRGFFPEGPDYDLDKAAVEKRLKSLEDVVGKYKDLLARARRSLDGGRLDEAHQNLLKLRWQNLTVDPAKSMVTEFMKAASAKAATDAELQRITRLWQGLGKSLQLQAKLHQARKAAALGALKDASALAQKILDETETEVFEWYPLLDRPKKDTVARLALAFMADLVSASSQAQAQMLRQAIMMGESDSILFSDLVVRLKRVEAKLLEGAPDKPALAKTFADQRALVELVSKLGAGKSKSERMKLFQAEVARRTR